MPKLRKVLSYSHVANSLFSRTTPSWWLIPGKKREHDNGHELAVLLLLRLSDVSRQHNARLLLVTLAVPARLGGNAGLPPLVKRAREVGIDVLDLASRIARLSEETPELVERFYEEGGHYSGEGNAWIAEQIAERLR